MDVLLNTKVPWYSLLLNPKPPLKKGDLKLTLDEEGTKFEFGDPDAPTSKDSLTAKLNLNWSDLTDVVKTRILKTKESPLGGLGEYVELATVDANTKTLTDTYKFKSSLKDQIVGYKFEGLNADGEAIEKSNAYTLKLPGMLNSKWTLNAERVKVNDATIAFEPSSETYTGDGGERPSPSPKPDPVDPNIPQPLSVEIVNPGRTNYNILQGAAVDLVHGLLPEDVKKVFVYASKAQVNDPEKDQSKRWVPYSAHDAEDLPSNDGTLTFKSDRISVSDLIFIMSSGSDSIRYYIKGFSDPNAKSNAVKSLVYQSQIVQTGAKGFENYPEQHDMNMPGMYWKVVEPEDVAVKETFAPCASVNMETGATHYESPAMDPDNYDEEGNFLY